MSASVLLFVAGGRAAATSSGPRWVHMLGNTRSQGADGIAVDSSGNSYVVGGTGGRLPGSSTSGLGHQDAFLAKFDAHGHRLWTVQLGSPSVDGADAVSVTASGAVYVAGYTKGTLPGSPDANAGGVDAFLARYDESGNLVWTRQIGGSGFDAGTSVAADDAGNVYMSGFASEPLPGEPETGLGFIDGFIVKYDSGGNRAWVHAIGTSTSDAANSVAIDPNGGVDVAGYTYGSLPGSEGSHGNGDSFVAHFADDGSIVWTRQFGSTGNDLAYGLAVDPLGNVFVTGSTDGSIPGSGAQPQGESDLYLAEFDGSGEQLSVTQLGSPATEQGYAVALDAADDAYVTGYTWGTLPGSPEIGTGYQDAFLVKFAPTGSARWVHQLGSPAGDLGYAVAVDATGSPTIAGMTGGTLPGSPKVNAGNADAFVARYGAGG